MTTPDAPAPIVLFAYARLDHLKQTVASLQANPEATSSALVVYCDGPRDDTARAATDAVRAYVDGLQGFASIRRVYRDANYGLARSIITGVTEVLQTHARVIVLEDDLRLSPHFLAYMNGALACYADDAAVASIHGYCYPTRQDLPETFFLRGADCWGWATWARAWRHFEPDGSKLLRQLQQRRLCRAFDMDGSYPFTRMLRGQIAGRNNSWAIRWHASCYLQDMLTLYPGRSLVQNIGLDDSGTHCAATDVYCGPLREGALAVKRQPLQESAEARAAFVEFFHATRETLFDKVRRKLVARLKSNR
jgi:hypothetical protein